MFIPVARPAPPPQTTKAAPDWRELMSDALLIAAFVGTLYGLWKGR